MDKLIQDNYDSIVKRGLITKDTTILDFINKLEEEVHEFTDSFLLDLENKEEELADVILVCLNIAKHYNIDIEKELNNKVKINKTRND